MILSDPSPRGQPSKSLSLTHDLSALTPNITSATSMAPPSSTDPQESAPSGGSGEKTSTAASGAERLEVILEKGSVGLGFCIEGGRGSPLGDRPITIKRLFRGKFGKVIHL